MLCRRQITLAALSIMLFAGNQSIHAQEHVPSAASAQKVNGPQVLLVTSMGEIVLQLDAEHAPLSTQNFVDYVKKGHYHDTLFHRVINGFMIQGGGYDKNMREVSAPVTVKNESNNGLKNVRYSVAMARTAAPQSASAQFFINVADNTPLDYPGSDGYGYAVFGTVIKGRDVVDRIKQVPTGAMDVPRTQVVIEDARVLP